MGAAHGSTGRAQAGLRGVARYVEDHAGVQRACGATGQVEGAATEEGTDPASAAAKKWHRGLGRRTSPFGARYAHLNA